MTDEEKKKLEFFQEILDKDGASVMTVKDGHVIGIKKTTLEAFLKKHPDQEMFLIFVKNREFKN